MSITPEIFEQMNIKMDNCLSIFNKYKNIWFETDKTKTIEKLTDAGVVLVQLKLSIDLLNQNKIEQFTKTIGMALFKGKLKNVIMSLYCFSNKGKKQNKTQTQNQKQDIDNEEENDSLSLSIEQVIQDRNLMRENLVGFIRLLDIEIKTNPNFTHLVKINPTITQI